VKKKIGVLISGGGSNLQALIDACAQAEFPAEIVTVISNKESALGLNRASNAGIPAHIINHKDYKTREAFDEAVHELLLHHNVEMVCLAGFMRLLTPGCVSKWKDKMINIHPSLLPAFPGVHVHEQVLAAGVRFSGCTVHFVCSEVDSGPIIIQAAVPVAPADTVETLAARVLEQEHRIYPLALRWLAEGRLAIKDKTVIVKNSKSVSGALVNPIH